MLQHFSSQRREVIHRGKSQYNRSVSHRTQFACLALDADSPKWSNSRMAVELVKELAGEPMPNSTYDAWINLAYNLKFSGAKIEFSDSEDQYEFDKAIERKKAEMAR